MRVFQRHVHAAFVESFESQRDVSLRLVLEERLIALLTQARRGIHDKFRVTAERNPAVGRQVVGVWRLPVGGRGFWPHLQQNQIILAIEVRGHLTKRFPIHAFVINAESTPRRLALENLVEQLRDARASLAGAGVAGDEPAATKILP